MFLSKRVPLFPAPYTKITGSWKVIQLHGPQPRAAHVECLVTGTIARPATRIDGNQGLQIRGGSLERSDGGQAM
jgi:hypothetical protein